jgi:ABC-type dipeptide/oligopeptide/nickel transport system permease subunit
MTKLKQNINVFLSNKLGMTGVVILMVFVLIAVFAPYVAPFDPFERVGTPFQPPSMEYLLGTNDIGQDIFSEVVYGTRISLVMGVLSAGVALVIGTLVGLTAGYFGGKVDSILMRVVDLIMVIPMLPLMILLAAFVGPSFWNIIIVIGALSWASPDSM